MSSSPTCDTGPCLRQRAGAARAAAQVENLWSMCDIRSQAQKKSQQPKHTPSAGNLPKSLQTETPDKCMRFKVCLCREKPAGLWLPVLLRSCIPWQVKARRFPFTGSGAQSCSAGGYITGQFTPFCHLCTPSTLLWPLTSLSSTGGGGTSLMICKWKGEWVSGVL